MLKNKNLDGVCLNILDESNNFGSDNNNIEFLTQDENIKISGDKLSVSLELIENIKKSFNE
jgi:phosphopantothenoylcysteine decarboxylase/phosphopantothenate--cysteine ligase